MRNAFMDIMDIFFESQEFEKYKASNMDTEEIFAKLVDSAVSCLIKASRAYPPDLYRALR